MMLSLQSIGRVIPGVATASLFSLFATSAWAEAPTPTPVTPQLIAAATKEGKVVLYTSIEVQLAEQLGKAFEAKYPGIAVQVERAGGERIFQRVAQETASNVHAVDIVESSDMSHAVAWKQQGLLVPFVPVDVVKWPSDQRDADGYFATDRATLSVIGYNTKQVKAEDAPKSFADLLDPKWKGKIVKAHPGYSGGIMTVTFEMSRTLGWDYFDKLSRQRIMQVQSATEPPRKLALGERPVMSDGMEYIMFELQADGRPVKVVYPTEGTPLIVGGAGLMKDAPHPNAARLFDSYLFSREGQQLLVDVGHLRSFHPDVVEVAGRVPLSQLKLMMADPVAQMGAIEEIRRKYAEYFGT